MRTRLAGSHYTYRELGGDFFDQQSPETTAKWLAKRIERLGYQVILQPPPSASSAYRQLK